MIRNTTRRFKSMKLRLCLGLSFVAFGLWIATTVDTTTAQSTAAFEYELVAAWPSGTPNGEAVGATSAVTTDAAGNVHAYRRTAGDIWTIDRAGRFVRSWAPNSAKWTHGIRVDRNGSIWTTDGQGHQVKKWSGDGKLLLTLGKYDVAGAGPDTFNRPTDVAVASNGDFFIADGYGNSRVAKFTAEGTFIKDWGAKGNGPGQFNLPHSIIIDARGRVLVADRENRRIQIFDQEGRFLDQWTHLGAPYALGITDDVLYVADGPNKKVWIANVRDGKLLGTIEGCDNAHWSAVDKDGNVYVASNMSSYLRKYARKNRSE
jgi:DNA-binding beta-propeller fold protein YncE